MKHILTLFILALIFTGCHSKVNPESLSFEGQIRNNNITISKVLSENNDSDDDIIASSEYFTFYNGKTEVSYWDDPVFDCFKNTGLSQSDYEKAFLNKASLKGIDALKLKNALALFPSDRILHYPVIVDTGTYNETDCFILVFTWEEKDCVEHSNPNYKIVGPLGHILITAIEADSLKVITKYGCT